MSPPQKRILESGLCLDPRWRDPATWARGECSIVISRGEISTDFTLLAILRELGMRWWHDAEIDSHWAPPQHWRTDPAVTHPHKDMGPADAPPPGISSRW